MSENTKTTTDPMAPPSAEQHSAMDALLDKIGVGDPEEPAPKAAAAPEPEDEPEEEAPEAEDADDSEEDAPADGALATAGDAEDTTEEYDRAFDALVRDYGASAVAKLEKKLGREDLILMGLKRAKEREKLDAKFREKSRPGGEDEDQDEPDVPAAPAGPSPEELAATKALGEALALDDAGVKALEQFARAAAAQAETSMKPKLQELETLREIVPQLAGVLTEMVFERALEKEDLGDLTPKEVQTLREGFLERLPTKKHRDLAGQARAQAILKDVVRLEMSEKVVERAKDERLDRAKKNGTPPKASRSAKVAKPLTFQDGVERRLDLILEDGLTDAREVNRRVRSGRPT